jgi:inward rectifier potassium channel
LGVIASSIAGFASGSFYDAFFFSVEVLSTVGLGHAYPDTLYGHCVVTFEVMVGLFGLAVVTGLIFVRFSRPTARMRFSNVAVVAPFDGLPTLMIRLVNLRHHAMVEAERLCKARLSIFTSKLLGTGASRRSYGRFSRALYGGLRKI